MFQETEIDINLILNRLNNETNIQKIVVKLMKQEPIISHKGIEHGYIISLKSGSPLRKIIQKARELSDSLQLQDDFSYFKNTITTYGGSFAGSCVVVVLCLFFAGGGSFDI